MFFLGWDENLVQLIDFFVGKSQQSNCEWVYTNVYLTIVCVLQWRNHRKSMSVDRSCDVNCLFIFSFSVDWLVKFSKDIMQIFPPFSSRVEVGWNFHVFHFFRKEVMIPSTDWKWTYRFSPQKRTWQWNIHHLKMYFLLKMVIFQCQFSGVYLSIIPWNTSEIVHQKRVFHIRWPSWEAVEIRKLAADSIPYH